MRGLFTCGVTDVLMENDIRFSAAAGISAGAAFGCNYKSRQPGRALRYNLKYSRDPRYMGLRSLIKTGDLYGAEFCYHTIPDELDPFDYETFTADLLEFWVGATDAQTGKAVYHKCTDAGKTDMLWIRASASMPVVSRPVEVDGYVLLDGGISDSVPFEFMEGLGYDRNVIILTRPFGYRKKKSRASFLIDLALMKYPQAAAAVSRRYKMYNEQMEKIDAREAERRALVIRPPESLGIQRTEKDPAKLQRVYDTGRKEAERRLGEIKDFLGTQQ